MKSIQLILVIIAATAFKSFAQSNSVLIMSEVMAHTIRFTPYNTQPTDAIRDLKPEFLISNLKTDNEKNAFWLNIYNGMMLSFVRDTNYQGVYTNFYKKKNVIVAGRNFSLFEIEHEFLLAGTKTKSLGFKKSKIAKDILWRKLVPNTVDIKLIYCMYRGLYGFPPFQVIENGDIETAFKNATSTMSKPINTSSQEYLYDWLKPYSKIFMTEKSTSNTKVKVVYIKTPQAVQIKNFYPKFEQVSFKKEEENPWLKK